MSAYISPERNGEGESMLRELATSRAVQPGPAHPRTPVPPVKPRPRRRRWRGGATVAIVVAAAAAVSTWWLRPYTPAAPASGTASGAIARVTIGRPASAHSRPLAGASVPLSAGAEIRTLGAQEADVRLRDDVRIAVRPNSRLVLPSVGRVDLHFGGVAVDTRHRRGPGPSSTLTVILTGTELLGERAEFDVQTYVHEVEVTVRDGVVIVDGTRRIAAGECWTVPRIGLGVRPLVSRRAGPIPCQ